MVGAVGVVAVGLRGQVQGDVLLCDQPCPDPRAQVLVEEFRHVRRADVFPTLEKAPG